MQTGLFCRVWPGGVNWLLEFCGVVIAGVWSEGLHMSSLVTLTASAHLYTKALCMCCGLFRNPIVACTTMSA